MHRYRVFSSTMAFFHRKRLVYQAILWVLLFFFIYILFSMSSILSKPDFLIVDDFSQFWASGKINLSGGNPYSSNEIVETIQGIGGELSYDDVVSIMLNPPWTLAVMMPFSLLEYSTSRLIWLLLNIALVIISAKFLWNIYGGEEKGRKMTYLFVFLFSPTLAALQKGQFTPIILFGFVSALYIIKNRNSLWIAGTFLALATLKPQLIYLLWLILLLWTIRTRKWQLLVSTVVTVLILTIISYMINPAVLNQYIRSMSLYPFSEWATPTIGSLLRMIFGLEKFWLQFLPMTFATFFFIRQWLKYRDTWDWISDSPMIVATSLLTTAYAWTYDAILFLIPIVPAILSTVRLNDKKIQILIFSSILVISILNLILHTRLNDFWFVWLIPSLFVWYLVTIKTSRRLQPE